MFLLSSSDYFVDTVASTVDTTKKAAESTFETGKSYIDSAKGNRRHWTSRLHLLFKKFFLI